MSDSSTIDNTVATFEGPTFDAFRAQIRGTILLPESPGYDESRAIWNGMIDRHPACIVRCLGTSDVIACVNFAREHKLTLTVKGGGHNIAGLAVRDGGLMIDMSLMRGVWTDPVAKTARAQAGCLLGDVDRETQLYGLAAVLGFVSNTGIAGLTVGGGFGYLTRRYGWTCDNVRSMEVVTADGRLVRADRETNSDLFWGLRGGGGNFGIVTGFEYELYPVGPQIIGGAIAWSASEAPEVLGLFKEIVESAPAELTCAIVMRLAPPAPWLPADVHGKLVIMMVVCDSGLTEETAEWVARIKSFGSPVGDVVGPRPYSAQQSLLDATQPSGRRYYWKSEYLPSVNAELFKSFIDYANQIVSPHSGVIFFHIGGALNNLSEEHSPAGNRDAALVLNITSAWDSEADDTSNIAWAREAWNELRAFSTGGTYVNFLTEEEGDDRIRQAYGANYERLVDVKTTWDPDNLFHANKNVAPRTA